MWFNLVRFACNSADKEYYTVLTEKQYDSYLIGEAGHPEGKYKTFEFVGDVFITNETIKEIVDAERT